MSFDLVVAGVGGQGSILLSHIVADAAIRCDSSRGSVLVRHLRRYGRSVAPAADSKDVYGPLVRGGDVVLALEPLEGLRVGIDF